MTISTPIDLATLPADDLESIVGQPMGDIVRECSKKASAPQSRVVVAYDGKTRHATIDVPKKGRKVTPWAIIKARRCTHE